MQIEPKVGLKAIIKCKVSYEKTGSYQLDIFDITSSGTGKFHELFEKLKLKLKNEGLFETKFKKTSYVSQDNINCYFFNRICATGYT